MEPKDPETLLLDDAFVRGLARSLVRDAGRAEDVAQDAWKAALENGPHDRSKLRAWLATAVRHLSRKAARGETRRSRRERAAAREDGVPPAEEILAREEARRRVVELVLALEEPYRSTLVLRYLENLPPRAIAKRLSVPVETVRTRTQRGLARLRAKLDAGPGGRASWLAALAPLADLRPAVPISAPALPRIPGLEQVTLMSTKTKIALTGGAALLVGLTVATLASRWGDGLHPDGDPVAHTETPSVEPEAPQDDLGAAPEPEAVDSRVAVLEEEEDTVPAAVEPYGSLVARVVWKETGEPVPEEPVLVTAHGLANAGFHAVDATTDADGVVRLDRVRAGRVSVDVFRGASGSTTVKAGESAEIEITIGRGVDVVGLVVDREDRPIADAEIWVTRFSARGAILARSADDGTFELPSIGALREVGARKAGYAPSLLKQVLAGEGAELELRLVMRGVGGSLAGTVVDPAGEPVEGALVLVGKDEHASIRDEDNTTGLLARPGLVRTDEAGRFRAVGVAPGPTPVAVRAAGFAIWRGETEVVAGAANELDARLVEGVTIHGRGKGVDGAAAVDIQVVVGDWGLLRHSVRTDSEGAYRLVDLTPGEIEVHAERKERGEATAVFHAQPGDEIEWDFQLSLGLELQGRVIDDRGAPLADWSVEIRNQSNEDGKFHIDYTRTDADGRFAFRGLTDRAYRLEAKPRSSTFAVAKLGGARPLGGEVVLTAPVALLPSVTIRGRVVDADGEPATGAIVNPWKMDANTAPIEHPDNETGAFEFGPLPAGDWRVAVRLEGQPSITVGPKSLADGETWDVGELRFDPPGRVRAVFVHEPDAPAGHPFLSLSRAGNLYDAQLERDGDVIEWHPLGPGEYRIGIFGTGFAASTHRFEVSSGAVTELEIPLRAGTGIRVVVDEDEPDATRRSARLTVRDADGVTVHEAWLWRNDANPWTSELWLAPGSYRLVAESGDLGSEGTAAVTADASEPEELRLVLR